MWMGGTVPLGYRPAARTLVIEPEEAVLVRRIFARYLELGSVHRLALELAELGVVSKAWITAAGKPRGGRPLNRGALFHLLRNRTYIGQIPHKDTSYPGQHPAIVDPDIFEAVQAKLDETAIVLKPNHPAPKRGRHKGAPLKGLIFDASGERLSPVSARRKGGVTYRYYVPRALQRGGPRRGDAMARIPAALVEDLVVDRLRRLGLVQKNDAVDWDEARRWITRVEVGPGATKVELCAGADDRLGGVASMIQRLAPDDQLVAEGDQIRIIMPLRLMRRRGTTIALNPHGCEAVDRPRLDAALSSALVRAEAWKRNLFSGAFATMHDLARAEGVTPTYAARIMRVAFLSPDLKRAILDGRQPPGLTLQGVTTGDLPLCWRAQHEQFRG
jgi:hypothetical protein